MNVSFRKQLANAKCTLLENGECHELIEQGLVQGSGIAWYPLNKIPKLIRIGHPSSENLKSIIKFPAWLHENNKMN